MLWMSGALDPSQKMTVDIVTSLQDQQLNKFWCNCSYYYFFLAPGSYLGCEASCECKTCRNDGQMKMSTFSKARRKIQFAFHPVLGKQSVSSPSVFLLITSECGSGLFTSWICLLTDIHTALGLEYSFPLSSWWMPTELHSKTAVTYNETGSTVELSLWGRLNILPARQ